MGVKGDKRGPGVLEDADVLIERLAALGDLSRKSMFGGAGLFESGRMFGFVDSKRVVHLKSSPETEPLFVEAGWKRHSRMPYYAVPDADLADDAALEGWARRAIAGSKPQGE